MGTNYYLKGHRGDDNPKYHIGKRSAAGLYCWNCHITLCKGGESGVHQHNFGWYERCPVCGKAPEKEGLHDGSVGRELGFNKQPFAAKTGVRSCSSFTWARKLGRVQRIVDEYGREFTRGEFLQMLQECPIQFTDLCGHEFF